MDSLELQLICFTDEDLLLTHFAQQHIWRWKRRSRGAGLTEVGERDERVERAGGETTGREGRRGEGRAEVNQAPATHLSVQDPATAVAMTPT